MGSPKPNTLTYFSTSENAARYVKGIVESLPSGSLSTMTIVPDSSGGYYVLTATATGLVGGSDQISQSFPVY